MLKKQRESTPGLFGAFDETYMATSAVLTSAASGPSAGSQITVMVDSGASGHFLDPFLIPGLRGLMSDYCSLDVPHKIVTVGQYVLQGIAKGTVRGHVNDVSGHKRLVPVLRTCGAWSWEEPVLCCDVVGHGRCDGV